MTLTVAVPLIVSFGALGAAWFVPRIARPAVAAWSLTLAIAFVAIATVTMLAQVAAAGLSEIPYVADAIGWCRVLYSGQHGATPIIGIAAVTALAFVGWRITSHVRRVRSDVRLFSNVSGIEVVELDRPIAFAVPGNPGGVVISTNMLEHLNRQERAVVIAHENAHLRYHHHVFVRIAGACSAGLPFLAPFARKVSYLTERWADEVAADRVGSRELVATTIARIALLPNAITPAHAQALVGGNVVDRFVALEAPPVRTTRDRLVAAGLIVVIAIVASGVQLHHLVDFLSHPR